MSKIKNKNTTPELILRKALWSNGIRYRLKSNIVGRPDILFFSQKIAVFVDGCFWHGCPKHGVTPKSNVKFWENKLRRNIERDNKVNHQLEESGWTVLRFWEHEVCQQTDTIVKKIKAIVKK